MKWYHLLSTLGLLLFVFIAAIGMRTLFEANNKANELESVHDEITQGFNMHYQGMTLVKTEELDTWCTNNPTKKIVSVTGGDFHNMHYGVVVLWVETSH